MSLFPKHPCNKNGFSFIELLIALALINLVVVGSMLLIETSSSSTQQHNEISWRNIENDEMTKMLSDAKYFGAISTFSENLDLKKCFNEDTHLCNSATDYPLTPIDLKSGLPLTSISGISQGTLSNAITFKAHCENNLSECDKADYFSVKIKTTVSIAGSQPQTIEKVTIVKPAIQKISTLIPSAAVSDGRPFNAILFIDSSGSMLFAKDKIKDALDALFSKLSIMNVNLAILPLDGLNFAQTHFDWDLVDPSKKIPVYIPDLMPLSVLYREEKYSITFGTQFKVGDSITTPQYRKIQFLASDSSAYRTAKITAAKSLVDYLFNINTELYKDVPLCSLLHYFENGDPQFSVDPMTPTFAMVISNENDESYLPTTKSDVLITGDDAYNKSLKYCLKELNRRVRKGPIEYRYWGKKITYKINFTALMLKDGANVVQTIDAHVPTTYNPSIVMNSSCMGVSSLNTEVLNFLNTDADFAGKYIDNLVINTCTYNNSKFYTLETSATEGNLCSLNETSYRTSWPYYIHNSCWVNHTNVPGSLSCSLTGIDIDSIVPFSQSNILAHSTHDVAIAVADNITSKIGNANFYYIPVVFSSGDGCALTPGAQYGTRYTDLATTLGMSNNITPICSSSFTAKINELDSFLATIGLGDFTISLDVVMGFTGVQITRGAEVLYPINGIDYKIVNNLLIFKTGYIQPTDIIRTLYQ